MQKQEVVVLSQSNQSPLLDADVAFFCLLIIVSSVWGGDRASSLLFIAAAVLRSGYVPSPTPVEGGVARGEGLGGD